jgi:pantoate--beta-alanine ligase
VLLASKGASPQEVKESVKEVISKSNLIEFEYVEILNNELNELMLGQVGRILIAAKLGNTRLIDNMPILLKEKS